MSIKPQELFTKIAELRGDLFDCIPDEESDNEDVLLIFKSDGVGYSSNLYSIDTLLKIAGELGCVIEVSINSYDSSFWQVRVINIAGGNVVTAISKFPDQRSAYYAGLEKIVSLLESQKND